MKQIVGDYWKESHNYDLLCVTTNGVVKKDGRLVMGAGIAKEFRDRYTDIDAILGSNVTLFGNRVFVINWTTKCIIPSNFVVLPSEFLASFPTKHDWGNPSSIELIIKSAKELVEEVEKYNLRTILLTRPGCGNGGLTWEYVYPILAPLLDDRFTIINKD